MSHQRLTLLISGKVQGVGYRASTADKANHLGLTGYAENLPNGHVKVVAEGNPEALASLSHWCRKGPPAAEVASIDAEESAATSGFSDFAVR